MRTNRSPSAGSTIVNTLKPYEGGTGQTTAAAARTALNLVAAADLNQPGGVAGLDGNGKMLATQIPDNGPAPFGVQGPSTVTVSTSTNYTITNYDIFTTYTLTAISGSVDRSGDTISYSAPAAGGAGGFILNGRTVNITVQGIQPNTPTLAATDVGSGASNAAFNCTGSAFSMSSGSATHASSDWQVASDSAFTNIVSQSLSDATNKTTWKSGNLAFSTTYYARLRYRDSAGGVSNWSNTVTITTKASYIIQTEEAKLVATNRITSASFGNSVAISSDGSRVAIGARAETNTNCNGAAYVFRRTGTSWTLEQKIFDSSNSSVVPTSFGYSVAMTGDASRLIISAYTTNTDGVSQSGKCFIYTRSTNTWTKESSLQAAQLYTTSYFGCSVSISDDGLYAVVGAYNDVYADPSGNRPGSVWIFLRTGTTWALQTSYSIGNEDGGRAGQSVSIDSTGTRVAATKLGSNGQVYVHRRSGTSWVQEAIITPPSMIRTETRCLSLSSDGTRIAVGAYVHNGNSVGGVYVYTRNNTTWTLEATIIPTITPEGGENAGCSVSLSSNGNSLVIGSFSKTVSSITNAGRVSVFSRNTANATWSQDSSITPSDPQANAYFGFAAAISGDATRVISGAYAENTSHYGAAYTYR